MSLIKKKRATRTIETPIDKPHSVFGLPVISDVVNSESSSNASREAESKCSLRESSDSPSTKDPLGWKPLVLSLPCSSGAASDGPGSAAASGWGLGFFFLLGCRIPKCQFQGGGGVCSFVKHQQDKRDQLSDDLILLMLHS